MGPGTETCLSDKQTNTHSGAPKNLGAHKKCTSGKQKLTLPSPFSLSFHHQLFSLSVFLTVSLSAAVNDAFHARNDVSSALKPSNAYSRLPEHESVFYGKVDQVER